MEAGTLTDGGHRTFDIDGREIDASGSTPASGVPSDTSPAWKVRLLRAEAGSGWLLLFSRNEACELGRVVHDLRTPLAAIVQAADRLGSADLTPADRTVEARTIARAGRGLLELVSGLLGPSLTAGRSGSWNPVDVVTETASLLGETARSRGQELVLLQTGPVGLRKGDPTSFRRILVNLIGNAMKFSGEGKIEISLGETDRGLVVAVRDRGPGIEPELLPRLFRSGIRGESAIAGAIEGHGLGLANVRDLAASLGGTIRVESRRGDGSTFTVTLPPPRLGIGPVPSSDVDAPGSSRVSEADLGRSASQDKKRGSRLAGIRILLVDDDEDSRRLLRHHLEAAGAEISAVPDGVAAESAARAIRPHVLLIDLAMPGRDGAETLRSLRSGGIAVPAIALTASIDACTSDRALQSGFLRILIKPVDPETLASSIVETLRLRAAA
jgi:CheY-like chemotaxis protein